MDVLLSVIIPAYNVAPYLEECVNSILASTFQDYEILLVNDGSMDETGALCDTLAERSERIRVFHTKNGGVCAARNLGIDSATGEYISFVDGDDVISPHMLELLAAEMKDDIQLVSCSFTRCQRTDKHLEHIERGSACKANQKDAAHKILTGGFGGYVWNKLYRKSILDKHSIRFRTEVKVAEDQFFTMDYLPYCEQSAFLNERLYYYTITNDSVMNSFRDRAIVSEKYIGLPRAWAYSAAVVQPLSRELETYAHSRAAMFYQTVLRKLAQPSDAFIAEAVTYVQQRKRALLHYRWGFKYYLSALLLCTNYPLWSNVFRQKSEAVENRK